MLCLATGSGGNSGPGSPRQSSTPLGHLFSRVGDAIELLEEVYFQASPKRSANSIAAQLQMS